MHLLSEFVIVVVFKFKDLLGLVLGLLNLFECSRLFSLQHFHAVT